MSVPHAFHLADDCPSEVLEEFCVLALAHHTVACAHCGATIADAPARGIARVFCTDACRSAAYRARHRTQGLIFVPGSGWVLGTPGKRGRPGKAKDST